MGRNAGKTRFDVIQHEELLGLDDVGDSLAKAGETLAKTMREPRFDPDAFPVKCAADWLNAAATARDQMAYWTRVIAEFAVLRLEMTQKDVARSLNVSTQTINRWMKEPVGFNWDEMDDPKNK
jgi:hypothetical protein